MRSVGKQRTRAQEGQEREDDRVDVLRPRGADAEREQGRSGRRGESCGEVVELESCSRGGHMRMTSATERGTAVLAFLMVGGGASQAHAHLAVGTTWVRTDTAGKGIVLNVEACCKGGLRLAYQIPAMGGQPASTMSVDSPMDGTEAPVVISGKPSGETMAIKRVDDHHLTAVLKMGGQPFATYKGTIAPDNKSMTVDGVSGTGSQTQKLTETWVRK